MIPHDTITAVLLESAGWIEIELGSFRETNYQLAAGADPIRGADAVTTAGDLIAFPIRRIVAVRFDPK